MFLLIRLYEYRDWVAYAVSVGALDAPCFFIIPPVSSMPSLTSTASPHACPGVGSSVASANKTSGCLMQVISWPAPRLQGSQPQAIASGQVRHGPAAARPQTVFESRKFPPANPPEKIMKGKTHVMSAVNFQGRFRRTDVDSIYRWPWRVLMMTLLIISGGAVGDTVNQWPIGDTTFVGYWPTNWAPINGLNDAIISGGSYPQADFVGDTTNPGFYMAKGAGPTGAGDYLFFRMRVAFTGTAGTPTTKPVAPFANVVPERKPIKFAKTAMVSQRLEVISAHSAMN